MTEEKTILQWTYEPKNFFEAPVDYSDSKYKLILQDGNVDAELSDFQDPVPDTLLKEVETKVNFFLKARMILKHETFKVGGVKIRQQRPDGTVRTLAQMKGKARIFKIKGSQVDIIIENADGHIVTDTRAERIAEHQEFMKLIVASAGKHKLLDELINSYKTAVCDPPNELVH